MKLSREFQGQAGAEAMGALMSALRAQPPGNIGGEPVDIMRDYQDGSTLRLSDGKRVNDIQLPSSNVLQFVLANGSIVTARPSGTEPKIKFYASCHVEKGLSLEESGRVVAAFFRNVEDWVGGVMESSGV